jgi:hypothetical protein
MAYETLKCEGRTRKSLSKKLNVCWWFGSEDEQRLPEWYRPEWSQWKRVLYWYVFRNPLQDFRCYVIGCQDRNYEFTAKAPANTVQRDDLDPPEFGFQWSVIWLTVPLPFISYSGRWTTWYAGWQPSGIFGLKFNLHVPPPSFPRSRDVEP